MVEKEEGRQRRECKIKETRITGGGNERKGEQNEHERKKEVGEVEEKKKVRDGEGKDDKKLRKRGS